jgi:hypothetical protein
MLQMNLLASAVGIALGAFIAAAPAKAAEIWGSQRLARLGPHHRASFLRWYRVFGIILCLGAVLLAIDSLVFPR